jgi:hypothetical protein
MRRGGEGRSGQGGRGGIAGAGGLSAVFAHGRSGRRTPGRMWAKKKKHEPSFSGEKTKAPEIPCVFSHLGGDLALGVWVVGGVCFGLETNCPCRICPRLPATTDLLALEGTRR